MRAILLVPALVWCGPAAAQIVSVTLQGPERDFGHFVGDLLTATAIITVLPGTVLDTRSLPPVGPASPIADVQHVAVGGTADKIEVRVTYQDFFSPNQVVQADMPGYTLAFSANGARLTAAVPGFGFTASPFRHDLQPTLDPAAMRPDHAAMPARAPNALAAVMTGLALMAAGLVALVQPWRMGSRRGPFATVAAQVRKPALEGDNGRDLMLALHQAFDASAGRHVFADDIEAFLFQHRHFAPLRERIAGFFAASRDMFFGGAVETADAAALRALCRDLARAERRG